MILKRVFPVWRCDRCTVLTVLRTTQQSLHNQEHDRSLQGFTSYVRLSIADWDVSIAAILSQEGRINRSLVYVPCVSTTHFILPYKKQRVSGKDEDQKPRSKGSVCVSVRQGGEVDSRLDVSS